MENPQNKRISAAEGRIVDNLLLEKISLAGIARAGINLKKMASGSMLKKRNGVKKRRSTYSATEKFSSNLMKCGLLLVMQGDDAMEHGLLSREEQS